MLDRKQFHVREGRFVDTANNRVYIFPKLYRHLKTSVSVTWSLSIVLFILKNVLKMYNSLYLKEKHVFVYRYRLILVRMFKIMHSKTIFYAVLKEILSMLLFRRYFSVHVFTLTLT